MSSPAFIAPLSCILLFAAGCSPPASSPAETTDTDTDSIRKDVTFYGVGKVSRRQQHHDSTLEYLGPLFFAEIFIASGGEVSNATVSFPDPVGGVQTLEYRYSESDEIGDVMYLSGNVSTDEELEAMYPSQGYRFSFDTSTTRVDESEVSFAGGAFPRHPVIIFEQNGTAVPFDQVDPNEPLVITWPPFEEGRADPNGILDDLIFVAIDSCRIEDHVHSGRPFEKSDYLTFRAAEYVVPAGTLAPGQIYSMYVEHALLPHTQSDTGVPAFPRSQPPPTWTLEPWVLPILPTASRNRPVRAHRLDCRQARD